MTSLRRWALFGALIVVSIVIGACAPAAAPASAPVVQPTMQPAPALFTTPASSPNQIKLKVQPAQPGEQLSNSPVLTVRILQPPCAIDFSCVNGQIHVWWEAIADAETYTVTMTPMKDQYRYQYQPERQRVSVPEVFFSGAEAGNSYLVDIGSESAGQVSRIAGFTLACDPPSAIKKQPQ
jgi:hypothetical protein